MLHELSAFLKDFLAGPKKIVITTHAKPDGDAMGSMLGLYHYLLAGEHQVTPISSTDIASFLLWMPDASGVLLAHKEVEKANEAIAQADLIFCLDYNRLSRTEILETPLKEATGIKVMIDHHLEPEGFDQYRYWDAHAASTAELVQKLIEDHSGQEAITKEIAICLYVGIMTDTGSFRFGGVTPEVHFAVGRLLLTGMDHTYAHRMIYDSFSERRLRFFGYCTNHKMVIIPQHRTAYIAVSRDEMRAFNIATGDTEGLVNLPMGMDSIVLSVFMAEHKDRVKLSFRSKGNFPADAVAGNFEGGGHRNAAGGTSHLSLVDTVRTFRDLLPQYDSHLQAV